MKKIALVSTPWPLFNRPSIQLGTLKAFLEQKLNQLRVDTLHLYLDIAACLGFRLYNKLSQSSWLCEPLYGALLYPENTESIKKLWNRYAKKVFKKEKPDFDHLCDIIRKKSQSILKSINWKDYFLIGFSICFSQLTSSLYFIKEIKKTAPNTKIVIGGSSCAGEMGKSLLDAFQEIDFVIQGEGEFPLYYLVSQLSNYKEIQPFPGLISKSHKLERVCQVDNLDELPLPDYSDYFERIKNIWGKMPFQVKLPAEISRGCWWGKCNFCNLNIQWKGYRAKSPEKILKELKELVNRYQILSISFMDNLLPPQKELFEKLSTIKKDLNLFAEIRANTSLEILLSMKKAGINEVQVGIEALSTSLLKKMNKGTTAIENIEIMKNCEAKDTPTLVGNIILQFPGSNEKEVEETLRNMDFVFSFRPLKGIPFWLGYGSYIWKNPALFFIYGIKNHKNYEYIFPLRVLKKICLIIQEYRGQIKKQKRIWKPVKEKIKKWEKFYKQMHESPYSEPILGYLDGGDFLIIKQRIKRDENIVHKLKGLSRKIFLYCEHSRSISEILSYFKEVDQLKLIPFLREMVDKKLMFSEDDKYLSLAVPLRGWRS